MKIIKLQSANFKRLKAIEIVPGNRNSVVVSGKNGQGKSSVLDSIFVALAGKDKELIKPIREGESKAEITVETEDLIIKRIFKQGKTELEIIKKDTGEFVDKTPQTFLDAFLGKLSFDPLEFENLKPSEQKQLLLKLAGVSLSEFEVARKNAYDERHDVGVLLKSYPEKTFDEIAKAQTIVDKGKVNVMELMRQKEEAIKIQNDFHNFTLQNNLLKNKEKDLILKIEQLKEELEKVQYEIHSFNSVAILPSTFDFEGVDSQIKSATEYNSYVDASLLILEQEKKRKELQLNYDKCTSVIEDIDAKKEKALIEAKMPIEGLSVNDDGVIYNKIPFQQLSSAEKLKVSMAIAMAMNPELRVIRIMDGSLLDEDNMKVIEEMAGEKDFQVWVEKVDSSGKVGFYIEDGEVSAINE